MVYEGGKRIMKNIRAEHFSRKTDVFMEKFREYRDAAGHLNPRLCCATIQPLKLRQILSARRKYGNKKARLWK
jgi:hypothetical protein